MDKNKATSSVDTEVELVPFSSTIAAQNVSTVSWISTFFDNALNLFKIVPTMSNVFEKGTEAERCFLEGITADSDPGVRDELATLRKEVRDMIRASKNFLEYCLDMAEHVRDEQHVTEIKEQLGSKILEKLTVYINTLSGYLKDCDTSFEEFRTTHKRTHDELSSAKKHFSVQHEEAEKEASDAVKKYKEAVAMGKKSEGLTTLFSVVTRAIARAGASGIMSPHAAFSASIAGCIHTYVASTNENTATLHVKKQERAQEEMAKKEKILLDAYNRVVDLREAMFDAEALVMDMKSHTNRASKKKGVLKDLADSNKEDIDFHDLIKRMDSLQQAADKIVEIIGEKGSTPISSKPDELVSNTQPLQATDHRETTLQELQKAMKAQLHVSLVPKPNGDFSSPSQDGETATPLEEAAQELGDPEQAEYVAEQ